MENVMGQTARVATGVVKFGNDWPGVFVRGDDALGYAAKLRLLLAGAKMRDDEFDAWARVADLAALLESCRAPSGGGVAHPTESE